MLYSESLDIIYLLKQKNLFSKYYCRYLFINRLILHFCTEIITHIYFSSVGFSLTKELDNFARHKCYRVS